MAGRQGQIPGLYSDKNVDWSNDNIDQGDHNVSEMDTSQTQNGKNLLNEMRMEKDQLGLNFVHSHRLLDSGEFTFLLMPTTHGYFQVVYFTIICSRNLKSPTGEFGLQFM